MMTAGEKGQMRTKNNRRAAGHIAAVCAAAGSVLLMLPAAAAEAGEVLEVPTEAGTAAVTNDTGSQAVAWYIRKSGEDAWEKFAEGTEAEGQSEVITENGAKAEGTSEAVTEDGAKTEAASEMSTETDAQPESESEADTEVAEQPGSEISSRLYDLRMETADAQLIWYGLALEDVEDLALQCTGDGAVYVTYYDPEEKQEVSTEEYAVHTYEEAETLYNTSNLNVRVLPDTGADVAETLSFGSTLTACGELDGWYLIATDDGYGYVSSEYVTENEAVIEQKKAEQQAAEQKAAQAAARQAADQAASQNSGKKKSSSGNKKKETEASQPETSAPQTEAPKPAEQPRTEVSRENVADCDDPSHGTTYITYSDGSVEAIPY